MDSFLWDKHFETGLENVDQQHNALVDLINRFGELLLRAADEGLYMAKRKGRNQVEYSGAKP